MLSDWPAWRRIAASALFCLCLAVLVITAFRGLATDYPMRLFQGLAVAVGRAGGWLRRRGVRRRLEGASGAVLVGLGVRVALAQR